MLRSPLLLQPIATRLEVSLDQLEEGLSIQTAALNAEGVLDVTLEWNDPRQGAKILEAISKDYLDFSLLQRQDKLAEGLSFLDDQAPSLVSQVVELQGQLSLFRRRNDFLEPLKQGEAIQEQRQKLEAQLSALKQREAQLLGNLATVRSGRLSVPRSQGSGEEDLAGQVSDLEKQLAEAEASFLPDAPQVRSLRDRLNRVRSLLQRKDRDAIEASLAESRSEQRELERQAQALSRRFASNPGLVKQYDAIQQRLDVARQNLTSYISTREDFRLEEAQRTVPWQLISPPRFEPSPVKPNMGRNLALTLVLGAVAGGGAAMLRDRLDRRYHHSGEVEQELALPLLGDLPHFQEDTDAVPLAQESMRNLASRLELLPAGRQRRLVLIASAAAGEGKSLITTRLAQTLADLGQRVLVVDADLRHPSLHRMAGATNGVGLSDLLADDSRALDAVIQSLGANLHLLSAGSAPEAVCRSWSGELCGHMVALIRNLPGYDTVLFDSPASLAVADALLLSRELDGVDLWWWGWSRWSVICLPRRSSVSEASVLSCLGLWSTVRRPEDRRLTKVTGGLAWAKAGALEHLCLAATR